MASVTTVTRVHQNSVEAVHNRIAWALRHVGSDVQEFWVADILFETNKHISNYKTHEAALSSSQQRGNVLFTFVIFPPLKLANLFSERVSTLDVRWTVKRLVAGTFFLHLGREKKRHNTSPLPRWISNKRNGRFPADVEKRWHSLGTHVSILSTQYVWFNKQFQGAHDVWRLLTGKNRGKTRSYTYNISTGTKGRYKDLVRRTRISTAMSR